MWKIVAFFYFYFYILDHRPSQFVNLRIFMLYYKVSMILRDEGKAALRCNSCTSPKCTWQTVFDYGFAVIQTLTVMIELYCYFVVL